MRVMGSRSCWSVVFLVLSMQSLADIAREEAERRRLLEQQGIEGKVIEGNAAQTSANGNSTVSTTPSAARKKSSGRTDFPKDRTSVRSFRNELQKLDRTIRQDEGRLDLLRARLQAAQWGPQKVGRTSGRSRTSDPQNRLREEIDELQAKLRQLRQQRAEIYEEGKKAGFLPGELDGKGIIP